MALGHFQRSQKGEEAASLLFYKRESNRRYSQILVDDYECLYWSYKHLFPDRMTLFPSACGIAVSEKFITAEEKIRSGNQTMMAVSECLRENYVPPFPKKSTITNKTSPKEIILRKSFGVNEVENRRHSPSVVDTPKYSSKRNAGKFPMKTTNCRGMSHVVPSDNLETNEVENRRHSPNVVHVPKYSSKRNTRKLPMKTTNCRGMSHDVRRSSQSHDVLSEVNEVNEVENRRHSPSLMDVPKCSFKKNAGKLSMKTANAPRTSHEVLSENFAKRNSRQLPKKSTCSSSTYSEVYAKNELKKYYNREIINESGYLNKKENFFISKRISSPEIMTNDFEEVEVFRQKLNDLIQNLNRCAKSRVDFIVVFPEWKRCRMENITLLNDLANELDELHKNCNVAKATASVGGIVSSIFGIAGIMTGSHPLKLAATIGNFASSATSEVTTLVELKKTSDIIEKVKILILKDRQKFQELMKWEEMSRSLVIAIQDICDHEIVQSVFDAILARIPKTVSLAMKIDEIVNEVIREISNLSKQPLSTNSVSNITSLCKMICSNSQLVPKITEVSELLKESATLLGAVKFSLNAFINFRCIAKRSFFNKQLSVTSLRYKTLAGVAFDTISIICDVIALVKLQEDFKNGSISQHSGKVRRVKEELREELDSLEEMYYYMSFGGRKIMQL